MGLCTQEGVGRVYHICTLITLEGTDRIKLAFHNWPLGIVVRFRLTGSFTTDFSALLYIDSLQSCSFIYSYVLDRFIKMCWVTQIVDRSSKRKPFNWVNTSVFFTQVAYFYATLLCFNRRSVPTLGRLESSRARPLCLVMC